MGDNVHYTLNFFEVYNLYKVKHDIVHAFWYGVIILNLICSIKHAQVANECLFIIDNHK
jgi:hypothetical protein